MTKTIRMENADTADYKVAVYIEDLIGGIWVRRPEIISLDYPTAMTAQYITDSRRLVIEEIK